jgi:hypothetical protein
MKRIRATHNSPRLSLTSKQFPQSIAKYQPTWHRSADVVGYFLLASDHQANPAVLDRKSLTLLRKKLLRASIYLSVCFD